MVKFGSKIAKLCLNETFIELEKVKCRALERRKINVEGKPKEKFALDRNNENLKMTSQFEGIEFFKSFILGGWPGFPLH